MDDGDGRTAELVAHRHLSLERGVRRLDPFPLLEHAVEDPVHPTEDLLARSEVLHEVLDLARQGPALDRVVDRDVGTAEAVDRLFGVADDEQAPGLRGHLAPGPSGAQIQVTSSDWIGSVSWNSSTRMRRERR